MGDAERFKKAMLGGKKEEVTPPPPQRPTPPRPKKEVVVIEKKISMEELLGMIYELDTSVINDGQMKNHAVKGIEMLKSFGKNPGFQASRIKGILTLLLKHNKIKL